MFVRFVVETRDPDSQERQGVFHAVQELMSSGALSDAEIALANATLSWFHDHLPRPSRFTNSRRNNPRRRAISWFRPTSKECLREAQSLIALLEQNGRVVERILMMRPGYVVYEDEFQIVAMPFAATAGRPHIGC